MAVLATHLSMADEPFLEKALDDRAQGVRQLAAELLRQLPDSGLCQRMAQQVKTFVQFQGVGKAFKVEVTLPQSCQKDWERDGINSKSPKRQGRRAWWLQQMIASTPLSSWQADPTVMASVIEGHEWQQLLLQGLGTAAKYQKQTDWANALLRQFSFQNLSDILFIDLFNLLSPTQQEQLLRENLLSKQANKEALTSWFYLATQTAQPWSLAFSRLALDQLINLIKASKQSRYEPFYILKNIAFVLHPELDIHVTTTATNLPLEKQSSRQHTIILSELLDEEQLYYWQNFLNESLERLRFRQEMHRAFEDSG